MTAAVSRRSQRRPPCSQELVDGHAGLLGVAPVGVVGLIAQLGRLRSAGLGLQQSLEPGAFAGQQRSRLGLVHVASSARASGLFRDGELQVGQAAQVQPGPAGALHQSKEDLVADRAAGDHAGGVVEHPDLGHRGGAPTAAAAADSGGDLHA
jgi:hypothetical protein